MNKISKIIFGLVVLSVASLFFLTANINTTKAESPILKNLTDTTAKTSFVNYTADPKIIIAITIKVFLGFLGIIGIVLIIYAGFLWMTAGGDATKVEKAKKLIINATIGIVIILAAYIITEFIISTVDQTLKIKLKYYYNN